MIFLIVIVMGAMGFRYLPVDLLPPIETAELNVEVRCVADDGTDTMGLAMAAMNSVAPTETKTARTISARTSRTPRRTATITPQR